MNQDDDAGGKEARAHNQSHREIALCVRQFFEQERLPHHRISSNNVIQRITLASGINKNLICKAHTLDDIKNWKSKAGALINVLQA